MERKFKELYLAGEIEFEAIDDYSYEWGISDVECTLREFLGLNEEEEDAWISIGEEAFHIMLPIIIKTYEYYFQRRFYSSLNLKYFVLNHLNLLEYYYLKNYYQIYYSYLCLIY